MIRLRPLHWLVRLWRRITYRNPVQTSGTCRHAVNLDRRYCVECCAGANRPHRFWTEIDTWDNDLNIYPNG